MMAILRISGLLLVMSIETQAYRPNKIRKRSSTCRITGGDTLPRRRFSLCLDTERTFSHWMKLPELRPPSGGATGTCQRTFLSVRVIGATTTISAGPSLKISSERINAGRVPACSWPMVGSKCRSHTSPRDGSGVLTSYRARPPESDPTVDALALPASTPADRPSAPENRYWPRAGSSPGDSVQLPGPAPPASTPVRLPRAGAAVHARAG